MTLRYPEVWLRSFCGQSIWANVAYHKHPTDDEREALRSYFYLTSRLYPCGECAAEFQQLLELYPPQTSSRLSAAGWCVHLSRHHCAIEIFFPLRLCFVHNKVNERLEKPMFDCAHLDEEYDCGCGHDDSDASTPSPSTTTTTTKDELTGADLIQGGR
jgi:hypothetical protein